MTAGQTAALCAEAMGWVGTPFQHAARVKHVGVDCVHLAIAIYSAAGMLPDFTPEDYPPDWMLHSRAERLIAGITHYCDAVAPPWQVGDLLVYRYGRAASHCGIYVGDGRLVHAVSRDTVRCDQVDMPALTERFVGGFRLRCSP